MKHIKTFCLCAATFTACGGGDDALSSSSGPVVINEVMPSNKTTCADEAGGFPDWIELYNTSDAVVDLGGYSITDNPDVPRKAVQPAGLTIAPKGVLIFWADKPSTPTPRHLPFKLSASGEGVALFDPAGKRVDQFTWPAATSDISFARVPDGTGAIVSCAAPTCGQPNGTACGK